MHLHLHRAPGVGTGAVSQRKRIAGEGASAAPPKPAGALDMRPGPNQTNCPCNARATPSTLYKAAPAAAPQVEDAEQVGHQCHQYAYYHQGR